MKNKLLKSSILALCAGIVLYIISLSFFSAFNKDYASSPIVYGASMYKYNILSLFQQFRINFIHIYYYYSVPISVIQNQYFPGFDFFVIALIFVLIGEILLLIGYFKDCVDERITLMLSIIAIFFGVVFSFLALRIFIIFNG